MRSYIIGRIVEPEIQTVKMRETKEKRSVCRFGILSGRDCEQFDVWDGDNVFDKVSGFEDGDQVIAVVNTTVTDKGQLRCYLNFIGDCPDDIPGILKDLVRAERTPAK